MLNHITIILDKNSNVDKTLSTKVSLENIILKINNESAVNFTEVGSSLKTLIQSASILELIKIQLKYYETFFLEHRLDHRLRIYCYPWPINYQLNHIVRNVIQFQEKNNVETTWLNFWRHSLIIKYKGYIQEEFMFKFKLDKNIKNYVNLFFEENGIKSNSEIEENLKKEYFYQIILKIIPKNTTDIENIKKIIDRIIQSNIEKTEKI